VLTHLDEINGFFRELQSAMKKSANIYVIGGGVLLLRGMKAATKDLDLVANSKNEFEEANKALREIGFKAKKVTAVYKHFDLTYQLIRGEFQVDLFHKKVCSQFSLSRKMIKRSEKIIAIEKINVSLCSNEDVFLFKTMTERAGDIADCIELIKKGLDWNAVIAEMKHQIKHHGRDVWITWIGERLDILEEQGLNIPIMNEIDKLREKYYDKLEKRQKQSKASNREKHSKARRKG